MKFLAIVFVTFFIFSCGHLNHGNFNKQKFTTLKSQHQNEDDAVTTKDELIFESDTKIDKAENSKDGSPTFEHEEKSDESITSRINNISRNDEIPEFGVNQTYFNEIQPSENFSPTDTSEKKLTDYETLKIALEKNYPLIMSINDQYYLIKEPQLDSVTNTIRGNLYRVKNLETIQDSVYFELKVKKYTVSDQNYSEIDLSDISTIEKVRTYEKFFKQRENRALRVFNRFFNIMLLLFLIALLVAIVALILFPFFPTVVFAFQYCFAMLVAIWVLSFFALAKVKHIDVSKGTNLLKFKVALTRITCCLGFAVAIGIIVYAIWAIGEYFGWF